MEITINIRKIVPFFQQNAFSHNHLNDNNKQSYFWNCIGTIALVAKIKEISRINITNGRVNPVLFQFIYLAWFFLLFHSNSLFKKVNVTDRQWYCKGVRCVPSPGSISEKMEKSKSNFHQKSVLLLYIITSLCKITCRWKRC